MRGSVNDYILFVKRDWKYPFTYRVLSFLMGKKSVRTKKRVIVFNMFT